MRPFNKDFCSYEREDKPTFAKWVNTKIIAVQCQNTCLDPK